LARVPFEVGFRRALKLTCPRCGEDKLFTGLFEMNTQCAHCKFTYEREPGYFLGSSYINYGWTAFSMTIAYIVTHFGFSLPNLYVVPPLVLYSVVFPIFFHRYARAFWLTMDCFFDHYEFDEQDEPPVSKDPQ
jgi:uncharacterized protein (DUF983 family)